MTQIKAMTESFSQSIDEPDDVIEINSEGSEDDEQINDNSANNVDVDLESAEGQDLGDNAEEVEEKEGEKMPEKSVYCDGQDVEHTDKQCEE